MIPTLLKASMSLFCVLLVSLWGGQAYSDQPEGRPIIHMDQTVHTFPTAFEGEELSHTFAVFNKGTAHLNIEKVTHS